MEPDKPTDKDGRTSFLSRRFIILIIIALGFVGYEFLSEDSDGKKPDKEEKISEVQKVAGELTSPVPDRLKTPPVQKPDQAQIDRIRKIRQMEALSSSDLGEVDIGGTVESVEKVYGAPEIRKTIHLASYSPDQEGVDFQLRYSRWSSGGKELQIISESDGTIRAFVVRLPKGFAAEYSYLGRDVFVLGTSKFSEIAGADAVERRIDEIGRYNVYFEILKGSKEWRYHTYLFSHEIVEGFEVFEDGKWRPSKFPRDQVIPMAVCVSSEPDFEGVDGKPSECWMRMLRELVGLYSHQFEDF